MHTVGAYEAKTHLPKILNKVDDGEEYIITRNGRPVAKLVPIPKRDKKLIEEAIAGLNKISKEHTLNGLSIKKMIDKGRP